jgi:hypothetical protein
MARSAYVIERLAEIPRPEISNWWHSGRYWYCTVKVGKQSASGCGWTKDDAIRDGHRDIQRASQRRGKEQ